MTTFYDIKSGVLSWFSDIRFYKGGIILFGDSYYDVKGEHARQVLNIIEPGDVLLRKYDHYLGSRLISGYWSHVAIYVGDEYYVIHMLGEGITKEDILTFTRCDDICVLRAKDKSLVAEAIINAKKNYELGIKYDYDFKLSNSKFYCTEFVDSLFSYPVQEKIGKDKIVLPDHFLDCKLFEEKLTIYGPKK